MKTFVRSGLNYKRDTRETALRCDDKSLAQQQFRDEVDINTLVKRFGLLGELPTGVRMPTYGDFDVVMDYHTALNAVRASGEAFAAMPAEVRSRFANDPGAFVDFCLDPANLAECKRLGLTVPDPHGSVSVPSTEPDAPDRQKSGASGGSGDAGTGSST